MKRMLFIIILMFSGQVIADNPQVILQTNYGDIVLELLPEDAPGTVTNFLGYVNSGFYDNTLFHRVINGFMIQTGGFDLDLSKKEPGPPIVNEFNRSNVRGTVAMAKVGGDPDSATSEFFINHVDNNDPDDPYSLDNQNGGFTVFAEVIQGMDVVDIIAGVRAFWQYSASNGWMGDVPAEPVIIEKAEIYNPSTRVYVSNSGSDTTGDGTYSTPYATIQKGCDMAADNDEVILFPGTYTGTGNRDIDPGKPLLVRSMSPPDPATVSATVIDCQADTQNLHRAFTLSENQYTTTIKGLKITGGYHNDGGAIYAADSELHLDNCSITGNTAIGSGGAVYCDNGAPVISKTIMDNNSAVNGGAICNHDSSIEIKHSRLLNNSASNGGGVYSDNDPAMELSAAFNNTIIAYNNASSKGGGVYLQSGTMLINNCNVVYNEAVSAGTALYDASAATVKNSIIYGTEGSMIEGQPDVTYSDVQGGFTGIGNIDVDPMFVDAANGDFHLKSTAWRWFPNNMGWYNTFGTAYYTQPWYWDTDGTSRCIDAGSPADSDSEKEPVNIFREAYEGRYYGINKRVNMGAYGGTKEASMPPYYFALRSDFNNDGIIDLVDLSHFASECTPEVLLSMLTTLSQEWLSETSWHDEQ